MTVIARYECPTGHGDSLTALREQEPNRWCAVCQTWVEPVLVEYVDATTHQGAVLENERLRSAIEQLTIDRDSWKALAGELVEQRDAARQAGQ